MKTTSLKLITLVLAVSTTFATASFVSAQSIQTTAETSQIPASATAAENNVDSSIANELKGIWQNQMGSVMVITKVDTQTGQITGIYRTATGTEGDFYPLIGWVNYAEPQKATSSNPNVDHYTVVSFSVRWGKVGSVASWNGSYKAVGGVPTITGQWLLSESNSRFVWDHMFTGVDTFTPLKK